MKDTELKKIIEGKDFTKEEDFNNLLEVINKAVSDKEAEAKHTFANKIEKLETDNKNLKAETAKVKDLTEQLSKKDSENQFLVNKNYVYKNINNSLDDESIDELMYIVNGRMGKNKDLKFEDTVKKVAEERNFLDKAIEKQMDADKKEKIEKPFQPDVRFKGSTDTIPEEEDNSEASQRNRFNNLIGGKKLKRK